MAQQRRRPYRLAGSTTKAIPAALTGNTGAVVRTGDQITALAQLQAQTGTTATPLPRDTYPYAFGPGTPLNPAPLDPVRRDTGRAEPRIYDYPVSWNLPGQQGRLIPFSVLRRAAEMPIISDCIRIRKDEISTLPWEIGVAKHAVASAMRSTPGTSRHTAEKDLRDRLLPQITQFTEFWKVPDRGNGYKFPQWITQFLDERMVIDAVAIYPRRTLGGELYAFEVLDGSTIKPLLDHRGGRPMPPEPAYQQLLHGFPRGEFTADIQTDGDGRTVVPGGYPADQLVYLRQDVRTWTPYGRSPVEMALLDLDTWMKRIGWLRAEYTDGAMPTGWMVNKQNTASGATPWTPQQVMEYETALNDLYSGDTAQRHRVRVPPPGWEPVITGDVGEKFKPDYDLHLLKLLVAHFGMTIHELGFTETQGLGSAGHAQGQEALNDRKGSTPTLKALAADVSDLSYRFLGMPEELEFRWVDLAEDDSSADVVVAEQVAGGMLSLNEGRDELGRPRYEFPEADMPALFAPRTGTITFLEGSSQPAPVQPPVDQLTGVTGQTPQTGGGAPGRAPAAPDQADEEDDTTQAAKAAEAASYRRWIAKGRSGRRPFALRHIASPSDLVTYGINPELVVLGKAQSDPTPERVAQWPGWSKDQQAAKVWGERLTAAVDAALSSVSLSALALLWLDLHRATAQPGPRDGAVLGAAVAFLHGHGVSPDVIADAIRPVVEGMNADGHEIGARAAEAMVTGEPADWTGFTPGDGTTSTSSSTVSNVDDIAAHRVERLAQTLVDGAQADTPAADLGQQLEQTAADPSWGHGVATTEISRASNRAARTAYQRHGIPASTWLTANDVKVCPICIENERAGPVPLGQPFPSGDLQPPAHPWDRCTLLPSTAHISPEQLGHQPDYQRELGEHRDPRST